MQVTFAPHGELRFNTGRAVTEVRVSTVKGVSVAEFVASIGRMKGVQHRQDKDRECVHSKISGWHVHFDCTDDNTAARLEKRISQVGTYNGMAIYWQRMGFI
jgi:hypothetical protein